MIIWRSEWLPATSGLAEPMLSRALEAQLPMPIAGHREMDQSGPDVSGIENTPARLGAIAGAAAANDNKHSTKQKFWKSCNTELIS